MVEKAELWQNSFRACSRLGLTASVGLCHGHDPPVIVLMTAVN